MRIVLIRHGETEWNRIRRFQGRSDIPLNEGGKEQVRALAEVLKNEHVAALYTSPLTRAVETALIIGTYHPAAPLLLEEGFVEMDLGEFDGMDAAHWAEHHAEFMKQWIKSPGVLQMPGGESLAQVQARAVASLERIMQAHGAGESLLVCSHNFVILTLLCHAFHRPLDEFRTLKQDTAAFSTLTVSADGTLAVETLNERSHLRA